MTGHIADAVKRLKRPRILVAGDLILDQYVFGAVHRISPEAPIPVLHVGREEYRLGGAANVAWNLASLGARVSCLGVIGSDAGGAALKKLLRGEGIQTTHIVTDTRRPTGMKTRIIAHHQQMLRVDREALEMARGAAERALSSAARRAARRADLIIISDYQKGTLTPAVCRVLIRSGVPVIVGLKGGETAKYHGAIGASLNQSELYALAKARTLEKAAREIVEELRLGFLVVTLGEKGLAVFPKTGDAMYLPTVAQEVYDVTGAGDTVLAAFALAHSSGAPFLESARIANTAAGIVVGKLGTAMATREEVVRRLNGEESAHARKTIRESELMRTLKKARAAGKTIVFTNGCFDILHAGHAKLLQFAKRQGDVLVVGLNSDDSIRRLKGKTRPIMSEEERAHVLAAMEAVDYIIVFNSKTPIDLIKKIRPAILVKGEDWKGKKVVGREYAEKVVLAPLMEGKSTTDVIRRVLDRYSK